MSPGKNAPSTATIDRDAVAERAYYLFEAGGRKHGRDQEDWFAAEAQMGGRVATRKVPPRTRTHRAAAAPEKMK